MPGFMAGATGPLNSLLRLALLAGVYYAAARLGLQYASIGQSVSLVWPPTGIALAAITLMGFRFWPGVTLGAFLANAATPVPLLAAAGISLGNTVEALVGAYLLRRMTGPRPQLDDLRHLRSLILIAAPVGTMCSATIGPLSLGLTGALPPSALPAAAVVWWTGDLLGALVVAPVFFTWAVPAQPQDHTRRLLEVVVLAVATVLVAELALGRWFGRAVLRGVDYPYLLFPFVIWAGLRFGARGASLMTLTVAAVTVGHTTQGGGPFLGETATRTMFQVAGYLGVVAVTGLVLAAAVRWERLQATTALAQSQQRLRLALDSAHMGSWFWSVEGDTLTWDENLRRIYELDPGDQVSNYSHFIQRVHPDDREFVAESVQRVLRDGGDLNLEFRILLPDGRVRWISNQGEVHRDETGRPVYMAGVCVDVTERRLSEERLRQAHRMESAGRLAGGVAHETNNQMSVILGATDFILRRNDVPEAVRADVEFVQKAAKRTAAVTGQLLAFSRRQILKPEMLDLNAVITAWEPVLRRVMGAEYGVLLQLAPELGLVKADPGQLEQVLLNLTLNARDAMPRGGRITLETSRVVLSGAYALNKPGIDIRPGEYAMLAFSDTGHGMDKETLSHIFEPFFTTKGVGKGTGLGLSMVYGIVKQSDGYIWAYSEPGLGSTFKIYLPIKSGPVGPAKEAELPFHSQAGETILVVEDEPPVRHMMKRSLQNAGYRVLDTGSATEALRLLQLNQDVRLVLIDVILPGMDGQELANQIREQRPEVPILFTSGYTRGEIERRGLVEPGANFIQKPLTPDGLVRAVRQRLEPTPLRVPEDAGGA
jgi:PAS domain S-box-containing protein